jgi:hypothetical protein
MKQRIIDDICLKLSELQMPYTVDDNYIHVKTEFYDVGANADLLRVLYELTVFVDAENQAVQLYVRSFDESLMPGGAPVNRPVSMFRKVKRVRLDAEGQNAVETVDLGAVPNSVKNTAFQYGWKFATTFNLNRPTRKEPPAKPAPEPDLAFSVAEETEAPVEPAPEAAAVADKPRKSIFRRLFGKRGYKPRH